MNRYKDTTHKPKTLETQKKWHSERFINAFLDCLLMAGMVLFVLILATYCQPARATYDEKSQVMKSHSLTCENTSQLTYENTSQVSISQAMPKHTAKHYTSKRLALEKPNQNPVVTQRKPSPNLTESQRPYNDRLTNFERPLNAR